MQQMNIFDYLNENINNNSAAVKKSFAQLKRDLQPGVQVKTVINNCKPEFNNEIRKISKVQTNAICFECIRNGKQVNSYLWYPKAKDIEYIGNTFKIYDNGKLIFEYEILDTIQEQPKTKGIQHLFNVLAANGLM